MGHCHFKFGNFEDALYYYEYANATFNRPKDIHLVHLRYTFNIFETVNLYFI